MPFATVCARCRVTVPLHAQIDTYAELSLIPDGQNCSCCYEMPANAKHSTQGRRDPRCWETHRAVTASNRSLSSNIE